MKFCFVLKLYIPHSASDEISETLGATGGTDALVGLGQAGKATSQ